MRCIRLLITLVTLLGVTGFAFARITIAVKSVGFDGYYRPHTVVPILVMVENTGDTVQGDFQVYAPNSDALPDTYRTHVTIPKEAKQPYFLYVVPRAFAHDIEVRFSTGGGNPISTTYTRCQELYGADRLLVVVGGNGSSLHTLNGHNITVPDNMMPRPWDTLASPQDQNQYRGGYMNTGSVRLVYADSALLPDNPEAYGSIDTMALMSDATEETLNSKAQEAIPVWVANGGHLLIAKDETGRLETSFYKQFTSPAAGGQAFTERTANADGGVAQTRHFGAGHVSLLNYDPDARPSPNWTKIDNFYANLLSRHEGDIPLTSPLRDAVNQAVMVRNLKPPNLRLIVTFLLIYLIMLVPINYFVLKKMDKRELAWITTPAIVLIFTFGAYGIGYITKGHRLVTNMISLVETVAGQTRAEATSQLLIFSPSRTRYRLNLGGQGEALVARELTGWGENDPYSGRQRTQAEAMTYNDTNDGLLIEQLQVNMWAFRQLTMAHMLDLGKGVTSTLTATRTSPYAPPVITGAITNNMPFPCALCELYFNGERVSSFPMNAGETVTVKMNDNVPGPKLNEEEQYMLDSMRSRMQSQISSTQRLMEGFVLVSYSADPKARVALRVNDHPATGATTVIITHL